MRFAGQAVRNVAVVVFAALVVVGASCNCGNPAVVDPDLPDAGPGLACGACSADPDCDPQARCIAVTGGKACVPRCDTAKPSCPVGFTCKTPDEGGAAACVPDDGSCCIDTDKDDYGRGTGCRGTDCDDTRATVNPGAPEACNNTDDNCDGVVDEGLGQTTCGMGACARTVENCFNGAPQTCTPGTPMAEMCNGADDDCNGAVDDGFPALTCGTGACQRTVPACVGGVGQVCMPGDAGTETCNGLDDDCDGELDEQLGQTSCGVGACARTVDNCVDGGTTTCTPGAPGTETCNAIDDDCNGSTDEGLGQSSCGVGACARTVENCVGGVAQTCSPGTPGTETCNGVDDNCDGTADEGLGQTTCGVGACQVTTANCVGGATRTCVPLDAGVETCNSLDDDCNGTADDGLGSTSCGVGACARTTQNCVGGMAQTCTPGSPSAETCNAIDDNCDGTVDEGLGQSTCGIGACQRTVDNCADGGVQTCSPGAPTSESCNGLDDNCDGQTDEGLGSTTCGLGACQRTVQNCVGGVAQTCVAGAPSVEVCDGIDNNCDGLVDNGNPGGGIACATGFPGVCAAGTTACVAGAVTCVPNVAPGTQSEVCDGLDNNCNGAVDEGNPGGGASCNTGLQGVCAAGATQCVSGAITCQQTQGPSPEVCDGRDNNCNGAVDEGNPGGGASCNTGQPGVCAAGTTACQAGAVVCSRNTNPTAEACNGLDDNCDGAVDNGVPSVMCPGGSNVTATTCSGGACTIVGCTAGFYNVDGTFPNGCECQDTGGGAACAGPVNLGALSVGQLVSVSGSLPFAGASDWYLVNFTGNTNTSYHPRVRFTTNPGGAYAFDIVTSCGGGGVACGVEGGSSLSRTDWEQLYTAGDPSNPSAFNPIPALPSVLIRVYRATGAVTCDAFTLAISD